MYLRYIYKLRDLHISAENYTEAGFTMKLYADQLTWSNSLMSSDPAYVGNSECQIKEKLYVSIVDHFDKGKVNFVVTNLLCLKKIFVPKVLNIMRILNAILVLGERDTALEGAGYSVRITALQIQRAQWHPQVAGKVLWQHPSTVAARTRIFPGWFLWSQFPTFRQGLYRKFTSGLIFDTSFYRTSSSFTGV